MKDIRKLMINCCKNVKDTISKKTLTEWSKSTEYGKWDTKVVDEIAEKAVINFLKKNKFQAIIYTEEAKYVSIHDDPKYSVILDPVDGSYNAIAGIPFYSISIAISKNLEPKLGDVEYGIVYNLANEEVFEFFEGKSYYNFKEIKPKKNFRDKTIAVVKIVKEEDFRYIPIFDVVRTFGSIALELCYLVLDRLDAVINMKRACKTVDIAACAPMLDQTGKILRLDGKDWRDIDTKAKKMNILAFNPKKVKI